MADVLPQLRRNGQWILPQVDSIQIGHRWGVTTADAGLGVPLQRKPLQGEPFPLSFVVHFDTPEAVHWWHYWHMAQTKFAQRRFAARLLFPNGWRYCVCQFTQAPEQVENRSYWLVMRLSVEVLADFATEEELHG